MTYQELLELKAKRAAKVAEGQDLIAKKDFEGHKKLMDDVVEKMNQEIDAVELQLAQEGRFSEQDEKMKGLYQAQKARKAEEAVGRTVDGIRGTNEYAQAFTKALRHGVKVDQAWGVEEYAPLTKALSESGGTPQGSDGGFLVPQDFDNMIHEYEKEYLDLSQFFTVETVRLPSGWRAIEKGARKVLPKVLELGTIGRDDQPQFEKVVYNVAKYGDRLQASNELLSDNTAGLLRYLAGWFAPKYILTKNSLLLGILTGLTKSVTLTSGSEAKTLRQAMITQLNTAYSAGAVLLTNQSGYAAMDSWEDKNGRSLLVPNPADPSVYRLNGRRVVYGDNDLIPDETKTTGEGESAVTITSTPIYVGKFKALGTLFVRKGIEVASTNVGGDAWATDTWELRALCRLDAQAMDKNAAFKALLGSGGAAG